MPDAPQFDASVSSSNGVQKGNRVALNNQAAECALEIGSVKLHGFSSTKDVANFLNIPYAMIPARFKTARLLDLPGLSGELDATSYGPRCPQPPDPLHVVMKHMFEQQSMGQYHSEFDCLHLNIYAPPDFKNRNDKIPVFAYIHGGAFNCGDNTTEFDGNHLVRRSIELGAPIVVVAINYRLNVLGFLSSQELIAEAHAAGESPVLNQGLNDQNLALQWIQSYIHYFGGDPMRVTLSGESAGAASVLYQLKGRHPLFQQALVKSTPNPILRSLDETQEVFNQLVLSTGTPLSAPYETKLAALRSVPVDKLIGSVDLSGPSFPIADPQWFDGLDSGGPAGPEYWANVPPWCHRVVIGYNKDEGALFFAPSLQHLTSERLESIVRSLHPDIEFVAAVLQSALVKSAATPLGALSALATMTEFQRPAMDLVRHMAKSGKNVWVYVLDQVDPFPGPLHGFAWHSFGESIMFYQPSCQQFPELGITADKMSEVYVRFFYGNDPWESYNIRGRKWSWDGSGMGLVDSQPDGDEIAERLASSPKLLKIYLEKRERFLHFVFRAVKST